MYLEDFVSIVEALGDKPGNLLPNGLGSIGHLKPLVDRLSALDATLLVHITAIVDRAINLAYDVTTPRRRESHARRKRDQRENQKRRRRKTLRDARLRETDQRRPSRRSATPQAPTECRATARINIAGHSERLNRRCRAGLSGVNRVCHAERAG